MTAHQSMVDNLTLPYRQGAYIKEIGLGYLTDGGVTPIPEYGLEDYAAIRGVALWDIVPAYLVAPRFDVGEEYVCLSFDVQGWPEDDPLPQVRIPARTPAGTTFIIPLGDNVSGMTRLTRLREWPEPPPEASPGRERWQVMALIGNLGRLLWTMGWERAYLGAVGREAGSQRQLATAHGYSLDQIGRELRVPRLFPSAYPLDPATIALYHLDHVPDDVYGQARVGDRVIDETGRYHGQNEGAERGIPGRFNRAFRFRSGDLPRPRCAAEYEFQQRLRTGNWNWEAGERPVRYGPYRRYGYREGAIELPGPDGEPRGVWVNDEAEAPAARGQVTSACYGFVPEDLGRTIERFGTQGHTIQQAVDYYGEWWGQPEDWFVTTYEEHGIEAPHERCAFVEAPLTYGRIPNRSAFDMPAERSFTIEAFILPLPTQDIRPRVIAIKSHEIFYGGVRPTHCVEGWALSMGTFNCIPNNVAWSVSDLPETDEGEHHERIVTVTADLDLGDGRWHHVAGVIDRRYQVARLYVDGVQRGCQDISSIGEIADQEDILLGVNDYHFDAPYDGLIDEVRLSNVARHSFHPALGESDERYRTRLGIYKPWLIPTYDNIRAGLRRLLRASPYGPEVPPPSLPDIDVEERDGTRVCTERLLRIRPLSLRPGAHIDLEGDRQKSEQSACGPRDERFFEWQLVAHANEAIEYATPNAQRMQLATARSLDELVRLLEPWMENTERKLRVLRAYEPGSDELRAVGRALHLQMDEMPASVLAAFAHKACFDYVEHLAGGVVRAAVREERDKLEILTEDEAEDEGWPGRDSILRAKVGDQLRFTVRRPSLPDQRYFDWLLLECGPGRGELREVDGDNTSRLLVATEPGRLIVKAEYRWQGTVVVGMREIRIGLQSLPPCERIGGDGALGVGEEEAAGSPEGYFHEALLVEHNDQIRVDYGDEPDHHRLQVGTEKALDRLLALIGEEPEVEGRLRILGGYHPAADDLASVGRKLMLVHEDRENIPLGRLAALAHDAGFAWVYHPPYPDGIFVATGQDSPLEITFGPIHDLAPNAVVNWLGMMRANIPEAPTAPAITFDATDSANRHDDPVQVNYTDPRCRFMTPATQERLNGLLELLQAEGAAGTLELLGAFDDAATNRRRAGAAVEMRHEGVTLERLGALAHQAGFDYVKHVTVPGLEPTTHYIYASVWRGDDLSDLTNDPEIVDYGLLDPSDTSEVPDEGVRELCIRPDVLDWEPPPAIEPGEEGTEEEPKPEDPPPYRAPLTESAHYYWCLTRYGAGRARLDSPPAGRACKLFTAQQRAGVIGARGEFVVGDATEPYSFELIARSGEEQASTRVPKPVYDDLMNFLEFHHPVGVEGRAMSLRQRVQEVMESPLLRNADTERTYPRYRQRRGVGGQEMGAEGTELGEVTCGCPPWEAESEEEVKRT